MLRTTVVCCPLLVCVQSACKVQRAFGEQKVTECSTFIKYDQRSVIEADCGTCILPVFISALQESH